jgi:hypothetical protein
MNYRTYKALSEVSRRIAHNEMLASRGATMAAIKVRHDRARFARICNGAGIDARATMEQLTKGK